MDSTSKRFSKGVHAEGKCGKNTSGYAAISSAITKRSVHELDLSMMSSDCGLSIKDKKKSFLKADILAYLLLRFVCQFDSQSLYVILLSSNMFMTSTIEGMVASITEAMGTVIIVHQTDDEFNLKAISDNGDSTCVFEAGSDLVSFFESISKSVDLAVMAYPAVTEEYASIISMNNVQYWCVPADRINVYVSKGGDSMYRHNAFPWSRYPCYSGFTIGKGKIKDGGTRDKHMFVGSFNYYEKMVSSVPYRQSCVDCYVLKMAGNMIDLMVNKKAIDRSNRLSSSSLEALAELDRRMDEIINSS